MDNSELSLKQKVAIALKTIIFSELKDNHDDTLIEKFCSFLNELNDEFLDDLIVQENLLILIDKHLDWKNLHNADDDDESKIDNLVIVLRICRPLFNRELIFNQYLKQTKQNFIQLSLEIIRNKHQNKHHLLNIVLFSLLNCICNHQTGQKILFEHFILSKKNDFDFIEMLFDHDCQTSFIQKEINLLLVKIITLSFDRLELQQIFQTKFQNLNSDLPKILYEIINLQSSKPNEFFHRYDIFSLLENFLTKSNKRLNNQHLKHLIKLIELILSFGIDQNKSDCFVYSTFLILLSNFDQKFIRIENIDLYRTKSIHFLHRYLNELLNKEDRPKNGSSIVNNILSNEEQILLENISTKKSLQNECFQQLTLLKPVASKKHLNLLLSFFEKLIFQKNLIIADNDARIAQIEQIYLKIYSNYTMARKPILQSIKDIYRKQKIYKFSKFFPILLNQLNAIDNGQDQDQDDDIVDIIIELIYEIIFEDKQNSEFAGYLNEFLFQEYSMLINETKQFTIKLSFNIFSDENDTELLLILLQLIKLIISKQNFDSFEFYRVISDTNLLQILMNLFKENLFISKQVHIEIQQFFIEYRNKFIGIIDKYSKLMMIIMEQNQSSTSNDNHPQLNLLDDIIHTSKLLSDEIVMDCY
ncbi:hypothetical protein DERP_004660 [Dermatophagoides pteronyssinus]|uniref:Uncharacterized protein n=1 Tax=Dermatophagoides pteronyssinus TaxID=6956 RepID=A0ABQ8JPE2_DERPT|nr:hypothetical protein DERP_004660 [Dermatophagoides pteronyssinus]